jgi:hypothetical protein
MITTGSLKMLFFLQPNYCLETGRLLDRWRQTPPRNPQENEQQVQKSMSTTSSGSPPLLACEFKIEGNAGVPLTRAENPEGKKVKQWHGCGTSSSTLLGDHQWVFTSSSHFNRRGD